jgi:ATP-dependent helicase/nuclease subunit B
MSTYFLQRLATQLLQRHPNDLSRVIVVLPTKRARLFLMRYLHTLKGGAFWAPRCMILPDWVRSVLPGRIGGELELIMAMFEQYRTVVEGTDSFETFLGWYATALRDFNDVDAALAPGKMVFSDLRNIREIENWDPEAWSYNRNPLSETQEDFLRFWKQLGALYHAFAAWQDEQACWTYARAARFLSENPSVIQREDGVDCIYFAGIAGYSAAERKLIRTASELWKVEFVWDIDRYYFQNGGHEAGFHARDWKEKINPSSVVDRIANHPIEATIVKCSTSIAQVIRASEILMQLSEEELDNTCVVINDEAALEPLLSALADVKGEVNLAIGKPLAQTNVSRIVEDIFLVRSHHVRKGKIYHKHFIQWLQLIRASGFANEACDAIRQEILELNIAQITQEHLEKWSKLYESFHALFEVFKLDATPHQALQAAHSFLSQHTPTDEFSLVARQKMLGVLEELMDLLRRYEYLNNDHLLLRLYQLVIARMKMQYTGEPIEGLQLLSLSETRALDFKRVFFLGANEDYFPGERFSQSYIPFDLRNHYKLAMPEDLEAIHSYTYHRLLQEAQEVFYLYSTEVADSKSAEPSRYIIQLLAELKEQNPDLTLREEVVSTPEVTRFKEGIVSSDFIRGRIRSLLEAGISPSALNKLVSCPLDFYYRYIARLGEEKEVDESMSSSKFGEIVHRVLEDFYKPFVGSFPNAKDFAELKNSLTDRAMHVAASIYGGRNLDQGIDHLSMRIAIDMLHKYIDSEIGRALDTDGTPKSRELKFVEDGVSRSFEFAMEEGPFTFGLRGKIDRADIVAGVLHVIDYKTGKISSEKSPFKGDFDKLFKDANYSKFLQLLVYIMMTRDKEQAVPIASFYSMRENGGSFVHAQDLSSLEINHEFIDKTEEALARFLMALFERESFEHDPKAKYCEYCLSN